MTEPTTRSRYWCELAWLEGDEVADGVLIDVDGERITAIERDIGLAPDDAVRLDGLTLPAFANAHSHAFHRALRGRTHSPRGTFWTWRDLMYRVAQRLDPDTYLRLARATFTEMAMAGIGVVGEFHYVHHTPDGTPYEHANAMGIALATAASDVGIRLVLLDTAYLHGGLREPGADGGRAQPYLPLAEEQLRFADRSVDAWTGRVEALRADLAGRPVSIGAAIHSIRAVDGDAMEAIADWTTRHQAPLHVHASEQPAENAQCRSWFGCSPIELLAKHDALGPQTTIVHATHASDSDIEHMAGTGAGGCLCPTTERDLADGIGPSRRMADAGVAISLGSDSHAVIDLLEEARAVELDERLASNERGVHTASALMTMATSAGYEALGMPGGGRIAVGGLADLTTVSLESVRLAGTARPHALSSVVFAGAAADVRHVVVAGRPIVRDHRHIAIDAAAELTDAIEAVTR